MVVVYLGTVHHTGGVHAGKRDAKRQGGGSRLTQSGEHIFHILRQIVGIRAGICQKFFLIQRLGVIQNLLGRVAKEPVAVPLKGSQVVQLRRLGGFLLFRHLL